MWITDSGVRMVGEAWSSWEAAMLPLQYLAEIESRLWREVEV